MDNQNQPTKTPEVQTQTPLSVNNSSNTKFLILILAGVTVTLIAIGAYALGTKQSQPVAQNSVQPTPIPSPTPIDETANWKTYVNTRHGYSFSYPSDWLMLSLGGDNGDKCVNSTDRDDIIELTQKALDYCGFLGETIPTTDTDIAILAHDEEWKDIATILEPPKENIVIAGEPAVMYRFSYQQARPNVNATRIYFNHQGTAFLIFLKNQDPLGNSYNPLYDQILSTFQFTSP